MWPSPPPASYWQTHNPAPDRTCYFELQYLDQWCAEPDFFVIWETVWDWLKTTPTITNPRWTNIELIQNRATNTTDHRQTKQSEDQPKLIKIRNTAISSYTSWFCFVNIYFRFFVFSHFPPITLPVAVWVRGQSTRFVPSCCGRDTNQFRGASVTSSWPENRLPSHHTCTVDSRGGSNISQ